MTGRAPLPVDGVQVSPGPPPVGGTLAPDGPAPANGTQGPNVALPVRVVPCLDVRDGRVVKGVAFRGLADQGDPAALASAYQQQGADEVVLLDVAATSEERGARISTVRAVRRELSVPLAVGGGVSSVSGAAALLEAGADKVSANTAAVRNPELLSALANRFGVQCVVVAIDAARSGSDVHCESGYEVVVRSGAVRTGKDAVAWARAATAAGAGEVLLTSFDRDGTRSGYELPLVEKVRAAVDVPIVASGGADAPVHMAQAVQAGADAVLAASIFHTGVWTVERVKQALADEGVPVRPPYGAEP